VLLELTRPISFGRWRTDGEFFGIEKSVAVTDGDGSQMLRGRMGMETMSDGDADGDGYNFCGNGWGWLDFPLPCRSLVTRA